MSVAVTTYLIAGIRLHKSDLQVEAEVPGCDHKIPKRANFCPQCGAISKKTVFKSHSAYDAEKETFYGYRTINYSTNPFFDVCFVGEIIGRISGDEDDKLISPPDLISIQTKMKEKIESSLWEIGQFGLWLVVVWC